ncbi:MAG TPA: LPXTG cell wall anchor domain-containing protein [Terriglobales bacterium]|nr:LPXTG cell wall anchor domain-containing protein [Terriglobales bacterium]
MLKNMSLSLLLMGSLICFGQVVITGGTATTGAGYPSAASAPLISTPDIALPGSGPAVGAPLSSATANDSRTSTGPSVHNPNGVPFAVPEASTSNAMIVPGTAPVALASAPSEATAEPFENGIQHFESGSATIGNPTLSLGQIARALRSQHRQAARMYTNDNITQMNARGVTIGNLGNGSTALASASRPSTAPAAAPMQPAPIGTLVAENRAPALPQSDREAPLNTRSATPTSPTAGQQRHRAADQGEQAAPATSVKTAPAESSPLPQTGSPLPLLLVIGGIGLGAGVLYWVRR